MAVTVRAIMVEAANIFVRVCFSSSILIIRFNVRRVRVKVKSIDKPLTIAKPFRPRSWIDGVRVRLMSIEAKIMIKTVFVLLQIRSTLMKAEKRP